MHIRTGIAKGLAWRYWAGVPEYWYGNYEAKKQEIVRSVLQQGGTAFDVGANAGFYTLAMSRLVGPGGHVYAFEPFCENVQNILRHRMLNDFENCSICQCAVAEHSSMEAFAVAPSNAMGKLVPDGGQYYVPTVSLDQFIYEKQIKPPTLLKIDVEGAEHRVIMGALQTLEKHDVKVLLAVHGEQAFRDCHATLTSIGYRMHDLDMQVITESSRYTDELYCCKQF